MVPLRKFILTLSTSLIAAMTVAGQENQPNTSTIDAQTSSQSSVNTLGTSTTTQFQKKLPVRLLDRVLAERVTFWTNDVKRVPSSDTNDAHQNAPGAAQDTQDIAKKLANPVASLISFPIQMNFDFGMGTGSGWRMTTNIQPVIPIALNKNWNLISRTILPIIHQGNVTGPNTSQTGLGDTVQSIFFSPNKTEPLIWGVGPVVLVPTATNGALGSKQLGLGATVVALKQQSGWTVGVLWNHIWRVAGGSGRPRVNSDFIQPFLAYSTKDGWTYTINTESTYDWTANHWSVPIHGVISKVVRFGKQPVSFGGSIRCWVTSTPGGPQGCGPRIVITGIFPKK